MNKFKLLAKKLLGNSLWNSEFTLIPRVKIKNGINNSYEELEPIVFKGVVGIIDKNLIDNINIFTTDEVIYIDSLTTVPKIDDIIIILDKKYKIIKISPLGVLNNDPALYQIVIRLA